MSKNKYLIDKKVILDCERMTLSRDRESLKRCGGFQCQLLQINQSITRFV